MMESQCLTCEYEDSPGDSRMCVSCNLSYSNWKLKGELAPYKPPTTSKEIHDQLHVLYSQYNDLGEGLSYIPEIGCPYTYELIQARYNALAQEIESISKKEWREA